MKTISGPFAAHLLLDTTTLATCWQITRTDGVVLGFTDHDVDLLLGGITYIASSGYFRSAIANSASAAVDNLEVKGFLDDALIAENDLRNGVYDYATVRVFLVNWADASMGSVALRYGLFGEVNMYPSGLFVVELRGLTQLYAQTVGDVYIQECRADVGDSKCKVPLIPPVRLGNQSYGAGARVLISYDPTQHAVLLNLLNPSFEEGTAGAPLHWTGGIPRQQGANLNLSPASGDFYLLPDATTLVPGATSSDLVSLVIGPVTTAFIDAGNYNVAVTGLMGAEQFGWLGSFTIKFYNGSSVHMAGQDSTTGLLDCRPEQQWKPITLTGAVPPLARYAQIVLAWDRGDGQSAAAPRTAFDQLSFQIKQKQYLTNDARIFRGLEFVCTTAGTTDLATPNVSVSSVGDFVTDGGVVWHAVTPQWTFLGTVATLIDNKSFTIAGVDQADAFFNFGVIHFYTGDNAGRSMEVLAWAQSTKTLGCALPLMFPPKVGDIFSVHVGCDRSRETCWAKFANILNFRGEPDIPGSNQYFMVGAPS